MIDYVVTYEERAQLAENRVITLTIVINQLISALTEISEACCDGQCGADLIIKKTIEDAHRSMEITG